MKQFGLTDEQVSASLQEHGSNRMTEQKGEGFWAKLWGNFQDPMIIILCVALLVNVVFAILDACNVPAFDGKCEWYESVGIAAAVLIATLVSTFSEYKNESAFQKLQEDASRIMCKVYRNGEIVEISIDDIVVGDCVLLQSGDKVPADGKIVDGNIQVDQSVLNGEAKEANKIVMPDGYQDEEGKAMDFLNPYKVFRGSIVCSGNAVMEVTVVGDKSVYGQIASELQLDEERETPLQVKLGKLAGQISKFGYIGGILIAVAFLFCEIFVANKFNMQDIAAFCGNWVNLVQAAVEALMLAVIIIVMAVPEGLPLMIAIVSAQNMGKMLKDNVLVRKISGIETAGSLNLLISDKTGTITKGQLETVVYVDGACNQYKAFGDIPKKLGEALMVNILNNTCAVVTGDGEGKKVLGGNATERALIGYVLNETCEANVKVTGTIPFNSQNKYSVAMVEGDYETTLIKGAPEKILQNCKYYYNEQGEKVEFNGFEALNAQLDELAAKAIRVLALATTDAKIEENSTELPAGNWTLIGVVGIRDEIRPESITAIEEVQQAGVQVIMITGDRKETAYAIAKEVGLIKTDEDIIYTSDDLAKLTDEELKEQLKHIRVVARALPSDKSRFVRIAQDLNLVVGMTGDGVNDSPALKRADIGFAMGGGTEVAKEASEIVILDDNFHSIEKAVLYGRTIFNNIRKFIIYQLTINVTAVLISFICPLIGIENPLSIIQILWVNLIMDTLAALAFGGEPALKRYMKEPPKRRDEAIVSKYMWATILTGALWTVGLSLIMLLTPVKDWFREGHLLTGYFTFFIMTAIFNAFNTRTENFSIFSNIGKNKGFLIVMGAILAVQVVITYVGGDVLGCYGLNWQEWAIVLVGALSIIPVDMAKKAIVKAIHKK